MGGRNGKTKDEKSTSIPGRKESQESTSRGVASLRDKLLRVDQGQDRETIEHRTYTIPLKLKSLNKILRSHWAVRSKEQKVWHEYLAYTVKKPRGFRFYNRVNITSFRKRQLDFDNLVGSAKSVVIDNLVKLGLLKDDNPNDVYVEYSQCKSKDEKTVITLWRDRD